MAKSFDRSQSRWFKLAQPEKWRLPTEFWPRIGTLLGRSFTRRCLYCGKSHIFKNWWTYKDTCPNCGIPFEREEGYFVGTYAVNIVVSEFLAFGIILAMLIWGDFSVLQLQIYGVILAIAFPIIGYPIASQIWIGIDLMADPPEKTRWLEAGRPDLAARTDASPIAS